jgi:hypothetical protein
MLAALAEGRSTWPQIDVGEMADLMAYLQADPARDPAPDTGCAEPVMPRRLGTKEVVDEDA